MRLAALLALLLAGCATPSTGVVPLSEGYFKVARQGSHAGVTTDSLKSAALEEADRHCRTLGRPLRVINTKEIPARPFGGWPEAEVTFSCTQ